MGTGNVNKMTHPPTLVVMRRRTRFSARHRVPLKYGCSDANFFLSTLLTALKFTMNFTNTQNTGKRLYQAKLKSTGLSFVCTRRGEIFDILHFMLAGKCKHLFTCLRLCSISTICLTIIVLKIVPIRFTFKVFIKSFPTG